MRSIVIFRFFSHFSLLFVYQCITFLPLIFRFSFYTPPCCHPLHPGVESWYIRVLRRVTWGCLRNYVLVFAKKRKSFLILNIGGLEITLAVP